MTTRASREHVAEEVHRVVDRMGGPSKTAQFFGIRQPAVSQWLSKGRLPKARRRHLMDIYPDLFAEHGDAAAPVAG